MKRKASTRTRVLFVGHEASRTGAPIMLLTLLRWLKTNSELDFEIALRRGGPLVEEYAKLGSVYQVNAWTEVHRWWKPFDGARLFLYLAKRLLKRDVGLIYANSLASARLVKVISILNVPIVCHVHEVGSYFRALGHEQLRAIAPAQPYFIAVTERIRANLEVSIKREQTEVIPGFVPIYPSANGDEWSRNWSRREFRQLHGIPEEAVLVGGCGSLHWQKGPDLFLQVAEQLSCRPASRQVHFIWLGGTKGQPPSDEFSHEVQRKRLQSSVTLVHSVADPSTFFQSLDIFALTSRDDPLPLVLLEAGLNSLPAICFAGNAEPVIDRVTGLSVRPEDTYEFAERVRELVENVELRMDLGRRLRSKVIQEHNVEHAAPRILGAIQCRLSAAEIS